MTPEELTKYLEAHEYRFAKTMPQIPHYYTLRKEWEDGKVFEEVVQAIRDLGEKRPWPAPPKKARYRYTYFDVGDWSYWSMGAPLEKTILINRAKRYDPTTAQPADEKQDAKPAEKNEEVKVEAEPESQDDVSVPEPTKQEATVENGSLRSVRFTTENALITIDPVNPAELFVPKVIESLIAKVKTITDKHVPDISTPSGRKATISLAYAVTSAKTMVDGIGKDYVAELEALPKKVNGQRKRFREAMDEIRDTTRRPVTEWEEAEAEKARIEAFAVKKDADEEDAYAAEALRELERKVAEQDKELARHAEEKRLADEAVRVAEEKAAQAEKDKIAAEAKARADKEAAEAKAKRDIEEAIQREKEQAAQAEQDRIDAEAKAKADQEAAVKAAELRVQQEAEQKEAKRLADEKAEKEKAEKAAANQRHRAKVDGEITEDIQGVCVAEGMAWDADCVKSIIMHVNKGHIRNITINY